MQPHFLGTRSCYIEKRTRSSSIALGIVNPSLTCQQTCRLGNNNAHALYNYKMRMRYRTTKRVCVLQFHNACAFCKFKNRIKNTQSPTRESFSPNSIAKRSVERVPKERGRVPKDLERIPIPPFEDKSSTESTY